MLHWTVDCYVPTNLSFAASSYGTSEIKHVFEIVKDTLGRPSSGITKVDCTLYEDGLVIKKFEFTNAKFAEEKLKLLMTFS